MVIPANLFDAHHRLYQQDIPFWESLAASQGGPVLELGCGTGRVLIPLAAAGYKVWGIDRDLDRLGLLVTQLPPEFRTQVHLLCADLTSYHLSKQFPLILLSCNTLSTLLLKEQEALFKCVRQHLTTRGIFAASLPNPHSLATLAEAQSSSLEEMIVHPETGNPVQVSSSWSRDSNQITVYWHYDHLHPNGQVERVSTHTRHIQRSLGDYQAAVEHAELALAEIYGDFDCSAYEEDSPYLILIVRAP